MNPIRSLIAGRVGCQGPASKVVASFLAPAVRVLLLLALPVVVAATAQETNDASQTNDLILTNQVGEPLKPEETDAGELTNSLSRTNPPLQTNSVGQPGGILPTNQPTQTNGAVETNTVVETNLFVPAGAPAQANPPNQTRRSNRLDYAWFQLIQERNIFNPNRFPRSGRGGRREIRRPVRTDSFTLVGTMSYEKGLVAFFDGSSYEFRKALKPEDTLAGFKIAEIGLNQVKLAGKSNQFELRVGAQMRREDEGEWTLGGQSPFASPSAAALSITTPTSTDTNAEPGTVAAGGDAAGPAASPAAEPSSSGAESEVLKKLMQRREQEMNK
jgi:hypothetical protein